MKLLPDKEMEIYKEFNKLFEMLINYSGDSEIEEIRTKISKSISTLQFSKLQFLDAALE